MPSPFFIFDFRRITLFTISYQVSSVGLVLNWVTIMSNQEEILTVPNISKNALECSVPLLVELVLQVNITLSLSYAL